MRISPCLLALALTAGAAQAATLELISRTSTPAFAYGYSDRAALSADGRYVAFLSSAPDLAPGQEDENLSLDVFLHDRVLGATTLVSHAAGSPTRAFSPGISGLAESPRSLDISADGRYVAFIAPGVNLVPGAAGSDQAVNVFLWDRVTGTTTLVSHAAGSPGTAADDSSSYVRVSADGNFVVFTSLATNLVAGQADRTDSSGATADVFLWNRATDTATLVSRGIGTAATTGNHSSFAPVLSADGGAVVFVSAATDLLPDLAGPGSGFNVYAWQRSTDTLSLVSRAATSPQVAAGASKEAAAVSADGRSVAFSSPAANLVPGQVDDASSFDAFLYDRTTGEMRLVSHRSLSPLLAGGAEPASVVMSADGRSVAFSSSAADLAPGQVDTNRSPDVFVYDRDTGLITLASHRYDSVTTAGTSVGSFLGAGPRLSADGRFLVFLSLYVDLVPGQTGRSMNNVFLYDRSSGSVAVMSHTHASASQTGDQSSSDPVLSADGSVATFLSGSNDLVEEQTEPGFSHLFLYDRTSGEVTRASRHDPSLPPPITSLLGGILNGLSADGRVVAGVLPWYGLLLRDTVAGTTLLTNPPLYFPGGRVFIRSAALSADGRFAALTASQQSRAGDTVEGLYLYDRAAGTFTLVNRAPGSGPGSSRPDGRPITPFFSAPYGPVLSADGRFVAYPCYSCSLIPGHVSSTDEIFLYDRLSGTNTLVSRAADTAGTIPLSPNASSSSPAISADGRYVVFRSYASNLVPGQADPSYSSDLFVFDREARPAESITLITHRPGFPRRSASSLADYPADAPLPAVLSADGRFIAFQSTLHNLVAGQVDDNLGADVFLYNQGTGANTLVSHAASSPLPARVAGNAPSALPGFLKETSIAMSADGRFIAYESLATDLAAGVDDTNGASDVFLYDRLFGTNSLVSYGATPRVAANGSSGFPRLSANGRRVTFASSATDLLISGQASGQAPGPADPAVLTGWHSLYVQDLGRGTRTFIARAFRSETDPISFVPLLSTDGRRVAFESQAPLVPGDYNGGGDVYLWDQDGGEAPPGPVSVSPCRLLDTRRRAERPALTSDVPRTVTAHGRCGVPDTAKEAVVKVTVFNPSGKGNLRLYPGDVTAAPSAILRFERGTSRTETFILPLGTNGNLILLPFVAGEGTVHGAVEVTAYED